MMTMRLGPYISDAAGASCRIHIILKRMCKTPAWSHPAVKNVHHRPARKTGITPLAPKNEKTPAAGGEEVEAARTHALDVEGQRQQVENDASPHHKLRE